MLFRPRDAHEGERGQAYLEFLIAFPILALLLLLLAAQAWWGWNQMSAAVAIHEGTAAAAHHGGSTEEGYRETFRMLALPLGRSAEDYAGTYQIDDVGGMRATAGFIDNRRVVDIPLIGPVMFEVKAFSFQRREAFYGGPPDYFE